VRKEMTKVTRWVVYGEPWNFSTHKDAVAIDVSEPDIAVNCHAPIEFLKARRRLSTPETFERFWQAAK